MSGLDNIWILLGIGCLAGYLVGAIPFGFLVYRGVTGADIRTLGSGNIGATNVGRLLGFRFFVLVFMLDVLKGFIPVLAVPPALKSMGTSPPADLNVFVALAAILGHNFPVYLRFKGGKGVATSLGALLALDPISCAAAAVAFFLVFFLTRFVSLSSIAGALGFVAGHFLRVHDPWSRPNAALSFFSIVIAVLIIVRHHKNIGRIARGTEPRVTLRRTRGPKEKQPMNPSGRIHAFLLAALATVTAIGVSGSWWLIQRARAPIEAAVGPWALRETDRELTGQQRSSRVLFAEEGRTLAVMCPRYNKILLYKVTDDQKLESAAEIALEGRPVALASAAGRLVVLERPPGDDKHLRPGWWESFAFDGSPSGHRVLASYYPDDLAVTPDGKHLLVLSSGRAEGDEHKPMPGVDVYESATALGSRPAAPIGRLDLDPKDDAERLVVSHLGTVVLVTLPKAKQSVAIDLSRPESPRIVERMALPETGSPYVSTSGVGDADGDWMIMRTRQESESVVIQRPGPSNSEERRTSPGFFAYTLPDESAVEIAAFGRGPIGRFPVKGPLNLGGSRPSGLAYSPERGLAAITTKPGTVHLVSIRSRLEPEPEERGREHPDRIAVTPRPGRKR